MSVLSCSEELQNLGVSRCKKRPSFIKGMITTPEDYTITAVLAATATQWQADILAASTARIFLWPKAVNYENIAEEQVLEETPLTVIGVRPGNYRYRLYFKENLELHKRMHSHNESSGRVFLIDIDNQIIGTSDDSGVTLKGFLLDNLLVEKLMLNDGAQATKTPVNVYTADNNELDSNGFMVEANFVNSLISLTSVVITEVSAVATLITVDVKSALDNVPLIGLVAADFTLVDATGASQTISGVTEISDGRYEVAGTGLVTGTLDLVVAASLSVPGFETDAGAAITI
jgi:hypothetical protein